MKISRSTLMAEYGIDLPKGTYAITNNGVDYTINTVQDDTQGCVIVGKNTIKGGVTQSKDTFLKLYNRMYAAYKKGETITITIK